MIRSITRRGSVLVLAMLFSATAVAQNRDGATSFRGIVLGGAEDSSSFTIVDRSGALVSIRVTGTTTFDLNRQPVNFAAAVKYGMDVRGTLAADGSAAQVSARGQVDQVEDEQLQAFMAVSDAEWAILKPKIDRIESLRRAIEGRGGGNRNPAERNLVGEFQQTLRNSFFNLSMGTAQLRTNLEALRQEQARARAELAQVRAQLQSLVTTRQEVLLVMMGILE